MYICTYVCLQYLCVCMCVWTVIAESLNVSKDESECRRNCT